jgi:hypothetical protein
MVDELKSATKVKAQETEREEAWHLKWQNR